LFAARSSIPAAEAYATYKEFVESHGLVAIGGKQFSLRLAAHGYQRFRTGAQRYYRRKHIADYEDIIDRWLEDSFSPSLPAGSSVAVGDAYGSYKAFVEAHGEGVVSVKRFSQRLEARGYERYRAGGGRRCFRVRREGAATLPTNEAMLDKWIQDCFSPSLPAGSSVAVGDAYGSYKAFVEAHGEGVVSVKRFSQRLEARGYERYRAGGGRRCFRAPRIMGQGA
jgi:predicted RNA binding protein YcfA (HicA-like mRNA interferase family)